MLKGIIHDQNFKSSSQDLFFKGVRLHSTVILLKVGGLARDRFLEELLKLMPQKSNFILTLNP